MKAYRYAIWLLVALPAFVVPLLLRYAPRSILGEAKMDASISLSLIGAALSYYGLLFSGYAALGVQDLSNRYATLTRSPDLLKQLIKIKSSISEFANEPAGELRAQSFLHEIPVALRACGRIRGVQLRKVAKEVGAALEALQRQGSFHPKGTAAGAVPGFWPLHQKIAELADELKEQIKDLRIGI